MSGHALPLPCLPMRLVQPALPCLPCPTQESSCLPSRLNLPALKTRSAGHRDSPCSALSYLLEKPILLCLPCPREAGSMMQLCLNHTTTSCSKHTSPEVTGCVLGFRPLACSFTPTHSTLVAPGVLAACCCLLATCTGYGASSCYQQQLRMA